MTFPSNIRSFETLSPFAKCGLRPAPAQIRPTLERNMPTASTIIVKLQCVSMDGVSCTVYAITFNRISFQSDGTLHSRRPRLVTFEFRFAFTDIPLLPPPDRRLEHSRTTNHLNRPQANTCREHDAPTSGELAQRGTVGQQS